MWVPKLNILKQKEEKIINMLSRVGCGNGEYSVDNVEVLDYGSPLTTCIILHSLHFVKSKPRCVGTCPQ